MINIHLNLLLIEDQDFKITSIKKFINDLNQSIHIEIVSSQIAALRALETTKFDIVLLDMCLPLREDGNADERGGELILEALELDENYIRPSIVVALTQYDDLQDEVRNKYPELGAIKYSVDNHSWQQGIERIIRSSKNSKKQVRKIIYCEEQNDELFNSIGLKNIEFRGLKGGSRKIYECVKFEKDNYAVRDKDYLTKNEVKWLTESKFNNYIILEYYCFENYLFHPENLEEHLKGVDKDFHKNSYITEITNQKNDKLLNIVQGLQIARNGYFDFTDNEKKNMDKEPEIINCLKSNDFATFYPYFDMKGTNKKKGFDKNILAEFNINHKELVQTKWIKEKMKEIFSKILT